jgi:hypothetical protein
MRCRRRSSDGTGMVINSLAHAILALQPALADEPNFTPVQINCKPMIH